MAKTVLTVAPWIGPSPLAFRMGGSCPKGRKAKDGPIPDDYRAPETGDAEYPERAEKNVTDVDSTVIFSRGYPGPMEQATGRGNDHDQVGMGLTEMKDMQDYYRANDIAA